MFITKVVMNAETGNPILAKGLISNTDYFTGEYRFKGMTYGVNVRISFTGFEDEYPLDLTPIILKFEDGSHDNGYYVGYTNTVYPSQTYNQKKAISWSY